MAQDSKVVMVQAIPTFYIGVENIFQKRVEKLRQRQRQWFKQSPPIYMGGFLICVSLLEEIECMINYFWCVHIQPFIVEPIG